jgi:hypothetical protein
VHCMASSDLAQALLYCGLLHCATHAAAATQYTQAAGTLWHAPCLLHKLWAQCFLGCA